MVYVYGGETWATSKGKDRRSEVNEMRILRWKCRGVTKEDKIGHIYIPVGESGTSRRDHVEGNMNKYFTVEIIL